MDGIVIPMSGLSLNEEEEEIPLDIQVKKFVKPFHDPERFYPMVSKPRGYAMMINNETFSKHGLENYREKRKGSCHFYVIPCGWYLLFAHKKSFALASPSSNHAHKF